MLALKTKTGVHLATGLSNLVEIPASEIDGLLSVDGSEDLISPNHIDKGIEYISIRRAVVKTRVIKTSFKTAKAKTAKAKSSKGEASRKEWTAKVQAARAVEEEYLEYVPLTEAEKVELFK